MLEFQCYIPVCLFFSVVFFLCFMIGRGGAGRGEMNLLW